MKSLGKVSKVIAGQRQNQDWAGSVQKALFSSILQALSSRRFSISLSEVLSSLINQRLFPPLPCLLLYTGPW